MPVNSNQFLQLVDLDPVLTEIFHNSYSQHPDYIPMVTSRRTSSKAKETDLRIGSFADPTPHIGAIKYDDPMPDFEVTYTPIEYSSGFIVERKLLDDAQYDHPFGQAGSMGVAYARKQQKIFADVFNNAFDTAVVGYDAKALCANDHPRSDSDSTAVDNYLNGTVLSEANLETAIQTHQALKDDLGEEIVIQPNLLIVPRALGKTARQLVESVLTPESAENAKNLYSAELSVVINPFLTDSTAWFLVDRAMSGQWLKWYDRIAVEFAADSPDFDTMARKFRGYFRCVVGWSDFRWILGAKP